MSQFPSSLPGIGPGSLTLTSRMLFVMPTNEGDFYPGGKIIDGAQSRDPGNTPVTELRPGMILGKITSTDSGSTVLPVVGLLAPSVIGTLSTAVTDTTNTHVTLTLASGAVELVRRLGASGTIVLTGAPTATGVVASTSVAYSAVNQSTGVVTTSALGVALTAGTLVGANDGSAVPFTVLSGNLYPTRVVDVNGSNMAAADALIPITNKPYLVDNIINYPAAANTTLITYIKSKIRVAVPGAEFSDDFT